MLLLVDNLEHLLGAAPALGELLTQAKGLRLLVTSRTPLHLRGEREYPLDPLAEDDAVTLFVERARDAGRDLELDDTIAAICRRLDSLPLAIELAAARTKILAPAKLLERLEQALPISDRRRTRRAGASADAARDDRMELRPARSRRTAALRAPRSLRRHVPAGSRRGRMRRDTGRADGARRPQPAQADRRLTPPRSWRRSASSPQSASRPRMTPTRSGAGTRSGSSRSPKRPAPFLKGAEQPVVAATPGGRARQPPCEPRLVLRPRRCRRRGEARRGAVAVLVHARPRHRGAPLAAASARRRPGRAVGGPRRGALRRRLPRRRAERERGGARPARGQPRLREGARSHCGRPRSPPPSSAPSGPRPAAARPIVGRHWRWARKRSLSRARQATTSCSRSR